ncbi:hypothetical protein GOBAR_AA09647 [Gossypium barbadense]|uniref:Uncharacterized protein n=1 Tax=Gossypium barbadense TaxID=3634 RepID=A0A2P5Y5X6_GOSBA|nr:hypothetical protein GOBAR_AA09647 [Gossypium barbadense]
MISERPQGSLPSNTEPNPKEHVKAVTIRSGKVLTESEKKLPQEADRKEDEKVKPKISKKLVLREYKPPILYPAKLKKDRMDAQFEAQNALNHYGHEMRLCNSHKHETWMCLRPCGNLSTHFEIYNKSEWKMGIYHGRAQKPWAILTTEHGHVGTHTDVGEANERTHGRAMWAWATLT